MTSQGDNASRVYQSYKSNGPVCTEETTDEIIMNLSLRKRTVTNHNLEIEMNSN